MKLSVVVVNYNMCLLLRQGLNALIRACKHIDYELVVIDDCSADGSVVMLTHDFPEVITIKNASRLGTAACRNIGINQSQGEYVLLVNANTICGKKTLENVLEFMDAHNNAGGTGVRMLTPQGQFITESRRGFNKVWGALFKFTGLAKYFSKSRLYRRDNDICMEEEEFDTTEVDVINGAFMLLRRSVLNEVGLLDERLAMFGHDIDLSFRIRMAGYKNYYYPRTYILSFSKSDSQFGWEYIKYFYGAMIIFAAKYLFHMPVIKLPVMPQLFTPKYEIER